MPALVLLIGLAVGVDYSIFYLRREREERAAGRSARAALEAAAATSGRSVLISGLTVMVAMAGMFITGDATFASFGVATMMVVAVAMLGSLTVLPALLSPARRRVDRPRAARGRLRRESGEGRALGRDRRPRPAPAGAVGGDRWRAAARCSRSRRSRCGWQRPSPDTYPAHLEVVKTYKRMQQAFPGTALPGERGRQGAERQRPGRARGDLPARAAGARERPRARRRSRSTSARSGRSRTSPSRSTAAARTRRRARP